LVAPDDHRRENGEDLIPIIILIIIHYSRSGEACCGLLYPVTLLYFTIPARAGRALSGLGMMMRVEPERRGEASTVVVEGDGSLDEAGAADAGAGRLLDDDWRTALQATRQHQLELMTTQFAPRFRHFTRIHPSSKPELHNVSRRRHSRRGRIGYSVKLGHVVVEKCGWLV